VTARRNVLRLPYGLCGLCLISACGLSDNSASHGDMDAVPRIDASTDASATVKCRDEPIRLVDYVPDVPDAGRMAVQVPDLALNATDVFYLLNWNQGIAAGGLQGALMRVPIRGGVAVRLAFVPGGGSEGNQAVVATAKAVIYSQGPNEDAGAGSIVSVPAAGGEPTILAATAGKAEALVADSQNVYFVDREGTKAVPLSGGSVRTLVKDTPFTLGVIGDTLYLADYGGTNTLSSVSVDGGAKTLIATDPGGVLYPVPCGSDLCWLTGPALNASLKRVSPGGTPTVLANGFREPLGLVFDGANFFVTVGGGGLYLLRIPAAGGTPVMLLLPGGLISGIAMDETCLYWSSATGIYSLTKSAADTAGDAGL
jgi:hypothetical protein